MEKMSGDEIKLYAVKKKHKKKGKPSVPMTEEGDGGKPMWADSTEKMPVKTSAGKGDARKELWRKEEEKEIPAHRRIIVLIIRILLLIALLYFFICSLTFLSSAFTLIGGRVAGTAFKSSLLQNPVCGLMIGIVATAVLQSSSTSTSIVITMVASNILTVPLAIPIVMGANIGTSVTGVIVSVTQAGDRTIFRRAFAAATVHDMFNWLTVLILLPIEMATGYLYKLSTVIVEGSSLHGGSSKQEFLSVLTKPFTSLVIQMDKKVLSEIAAGIPGAELKPLLKYWCKYEVVNVTSLSSDNATMAYLTAATNSTTNEINLDLDASDVSNSTGYSGNIYPTEIIGIQECNYLFHGLNMSETAVGVVLLVISLILMIICLIIMVKILKSLLQGSMAKVIQKTINADLPGKASYFTGYIAIVIGAIVTVLVQSSSVVASALTPLVGLNVVKLERVFPMMLGANIGTTSTALLAAFAATGDMLKPSFQIALCHLFFNLTGIVIWYPIPQFRKLPIGIARFLGKTTAKYRWFAFVYLVGMFFLLPLLVFGLSMLGWQACVAVAVPFLALVIFIIALNLSQRYCKAKLPTKIQTWEFLPLWLRSLEPFDRHVTRICQGCPCCKKCTADDTSELNSADNTASSSRDEIAEQKALLERGQMQHPLPNGGAVIIDIEVKCDANAKHDSLKQADSIEPLL